MDLKNLMSHAVRPVNPTTTGELPAQNELVQLSEEDLRKINGGSVLEAEVGFEKTITLDTKNPYYTFAILTNRGSGGGS
jgi:hypothetical protein